MKIRSITAYLEKIPLTKPYTIAYQTFTYTEIIYLEITLENGMVGLGSANPFAEVVGETPATTLQHLQSDFINQLIGRDISDFNVMIKEVITHFEGLPGTQAAIDIALHDAYGKYKNIPVSDIYQKCIDPLPTSITIGIKTIPEMLKEAKEYQKLGFKILKIKTGADVEEDIEIVSKLSETFESSMIIRVDANQGYSLSQLNHFIHATEKLKIELIEQPVAHDKDPELLLLPEIQRNILVADESLINVDSAKALVKIGKPYGVFNIKLMKCGGIKAAKHIAEVAAQNNINLFWGCNDESLVSITAALHTAYSCPNTKYLDLDGSFDIVESIVTGGFILKDGFMYSNNLPGFGVWKK